MRERFITYILGWVADINNAIRTVKAEKRRDGQR